MAEHDYVIANQNGANTRSDLNNALAAIVSNNSKATAPTTTYAFMWWADTANDILKQRNAADSAWISILTLSTGAPLADYADNALSGNAIDGGTISNFTSTGIDDNATSTAITIDASENVGIGAISPTGRLNIAPIGNIGGSGGTMSNAGLRIGTTTASSMYLDTNEVHGSETLNFFSNGTDNSVADYIRFSTGGSAGAERMRITSDGRGLSQFTAKAWFNINGSGTVSIRDSHNISSVTDYGVGNYRATFSNSLANANFSFTYGGGDTGGAETTFQLDGIPNVAFAQVQLKNAAGTVTDRPYWTGVIFGD